MADKNLTWKEQVHQLCKKVSRGIGLISKLRHYVSNKILVQLYYSLIYPFLNYGLLVWGSTYKASLNALYMLQKKKQYEFSLLLNTMITPPPYLSWRILSLTNTAFFFTISTQGSFHWYLTTSTIQLCPDIVILQD